MDDFENRLEAQKKVLRVVNKKKWPSEALFSLSRKAISRWIQANQIDKNSEIVLLIEKSAEKLFFLATKSQEQITDEYRANEESIRTIIQQITYLMDNTSVSK